MGGESKRVTKSSGLVGEESAESSMLEEKAENDLEEDIDEGPPLGYGVTIMAVRVTLQTPEQNQSSLGFYQSDVRHYLLEDELPGSIKAAFHQALPPIPPRWIMCSRL